MDGLIKYIDSCCSLYIMGMLLFRATLTFIWRPWVFTTIHHLEKIVISAEEKPDLHYFVIQILTGQFLSKQNIFMYMEVPRMMEDSSERLCLHASQFYSVSCI